MTGSLRGYCLLSLVDKYEPNGTPVIPAVIVIAPKINDTLNFFDFFLFKIDGRRKREREKDKDKELVSEMINDYKKIIKISFMSEKSNKKKRFK